MSKFEEWFATLNPPGFAEAVKPEMLHAWNAALTRAAEICREKQDEKDAPYAGKWKTLGSTEINGYAFARAIEAEKEKP